VAAEAQAERIRWRTSPDMLDSYREMVKRATISVEPSPKRVLAR